MITLSLNKHILFFFRQKNVTKVKTISYLIADESNLRFCVSLFGAGVDVAKPLIVLGVPIRLGVTVRPGVLMFGVPDLLLLTLAVLPEKKIRII